MPKPVKKPVRQKSTTPKPTSSAPKVRASQVTAEPAEKAEPAAWVPEPSDDADTRAIISAYMRVLGTKGGKVSGAKRLDIPAAKRKAIAKKAAAARWEK
jgi:hypothetical protein